jgi:hypothetical protein
LWAIERLLGLTLFKLDLRNRYAMIAVHVLAPAIALVVDPV